MYVCICADTSRRPFRCSGSYLPCSTCCTVSPAERCGDCEDFRVDGFSCLGDSGGTVSVCSSKMQGGGWAMGLGLQGMA